MLTSLILYQKFEICQVSPVCVASSTSQAQISADSLVAAVLNIRSRVATTLVNGQIG